MMNKGGNNAAEITIQEKIQTSVLNFCLQNKLFPVGQAGFSGIVYVAISAGPDSMGLLHVLRAIAPQLGIDVRGCHVNHGTRVNAQRDEDFVIAECEQRGIPLVVYRAKEDGIVPKGYATEDWARELRYDYFEQLGKEQNALLVTAHILGDQAETLLFRLARGSGVHGACGIRPIRGIFRRPFLKTTRQEVLAYCEEVGQKYTMDETNSTDFYARNRIRQRAIPALETTNTSAQKHLGEFCERMAEIDLYFSEKANSLLKKAQQPIEEMRAKLGDETLLEVWDLNELKKADKLILISALHKLVGKVRDTERKYIDLLADCVNNGKGAVQLLENRVFRIEQAKYLVFAKKMQTQICETEKVENKQVYNLSEGEFEFDSGYKLKIECFPIEKMENIQLVHKKDLKNIADYDKIVSLSILRTRTAGDLISPRGRGCTKTLKKYQNENGTAQKLREKLPLIAKDNQVLWLWGEGFSEGTFPTEQTKNICRITEIKSYSPMEDLK